MLTNRRGPSALSRTTRAAGFRRNASDTHPTVFSIASKGYWTVGDAVLPIPGC
jgi:hypothetical protein